MVVVDNVELGVVAVVVLAVVDVVLVVVVSMRGKRSHKLVVKIKNLKLTLCIQKLMLVKILVF